MFTVGMSSPLTYLAEKRIGVVIWCSGPGCTRGGVYVPPDEALERFGPVTCEEAQRLVKCSACGARGRDGKIQVLPSTMDMSDLRNGYPTGTSERRRVEQIAETERKQRAECDAKGWSWDLVYGGKAWPRV